MSPKSPNQNKSTRHELLASAHVVPETSRCVQCGICTFNCPIGIDVRRHAWLAQHVINPRCLSCGECIKRCPRGVLQFERLKIFKEQAQ